MNQSELSHELAAQKKAPLWIFFWKMVEALQAYFADKGAIGILPSPLGSLWFSKSHVQNTSELRPLHLELRKLYTAPMIPHERVAPFFGSYVETLHGLSTALCGTEAFPPGLLLAVTAKLGRELHLENSVLAAAVAKAALEYHEASSKIAYGTIEGCPVCGAAFRQRTVGITGSSDYAPFSRDGGCDHDTNRVTALFQCKNGHWGPLQRPNRCPNERCDWVDTTESPRLRTDEWPEVENQEFVDRAAFVPRGEADF